MSVNRRGARGEDLVVDDAERMRTKKNICLVIPLPAQLRRLLPTAERGQREDRQRRQEKCARGGAFGLHRMGAPSAMTAALTRPRRDRMPIRQKILKALQKVLRKPKKWTLIAPLRALTRWQLPSLCANGVGAG